MTAPCDTDEEVPAVLSVHFGRSANCSSIGSIVDFLFLSAAGGAAVLSALALALPDSESEEQASPEPSQDSEDALKPPEGADS